MKEGFYYRTEGPEGPPRFTEEEQARQIAEGDRRRAAQEVARRHLAVVMPQLEAGEINEARAALDAFAKEAGRPTRDEHCRRYISWTGGNWLVYTGLNVWNIKCETECPAYGLCQITEYVWRFREKSTSMLMVCSHCQHEVRNGVIVNGQAFCNHDCANEHHLNVQDAKAQAEGFSSYEDMMEHYGATIAEDGPVRQY